MNFGLLDKINKKRGIKLKLTKKIFIALLLVTATHYCSAEVPVNKTVTKIDSVNILAEFSLFYEAHRNKQFDDWTLEKGWNVINSDPTQFVKYKIFIKMEEILFTVHDAEGVDEIQKKAYADTIIALYDKAAQYDKEQEAYYLVKKAYVLENWFDIEPQIVIDAYLKAFEVDWKLDDVYKDMFGQFYKKNEMIEQAIDWYDKLSTDDPENDRWSLRLEELLDSPEELLEVKLKSWRNNPENLEKAWGVGSLAVRVKNYEVAREAFEFLTTKSPEVINYWKQLSTVYDKLDKTDKAINAYKKLIELEPDNREDYVNIALVYKKIGQLSISRSYLQKAMKADPNWDYPIYIEGSLYEQSARDCMSGKLEFMDKCVFKLAVETYASARSKGGSYASTAAERISALSPTIPTNEDYFFRQIKSGTTIKIEGGCYDWIGKSITADF